MYIKQKERFTCENILSIISIFALIALESKTYISMYKVTNINALVILFALIIINVLYHNILKRKQIPFNKRKVIVLLLMSSTLLFNKVATNDGSGFTFRLIILIVIAFFFSEIYTLDKFVYYFTEIMLFLCIYSLIATYAVIFFPSIFQEIFPVVHHGMKNMYFLDTVFCFVYLPEFGMQYRNYSIFSEPGVFQFYLNLTLILELWYKKNTHNIMFRIGVYLVTLISTFSTAGLIVGGIIFLYYFLSSSKGSNGFKVKIGIILTSLVIVFVGKFVFPDLSALLYESINKFSGGDFGGSKYSRVGSLYAYFNAWVEKPLIGWGYERGISEVGEKFLSQYTTDNTNTIFTNLGVYGSVYGGVYLLLFIKFFTQLKTNLITKIVTITAMLLSFNNENFIDSTIIFCLLFYSLDKMLPLNEKNIII